MPPYGPNRGSGFNRTCIARSGKQRRPEGRPTVSCGAVHDLPGSAGRITVLAMSYSLLRKGRYSEPGRDYLVTVVTHSRHTWFAAFDVARCVIAEMRRVESCGAVSSLAWVLMPDHLHWLFSLGSTASLAQVMQQFKGRSARVANRQLGRSGAFWQRAFHDHALRDEEDRVAVARYVVANPLRAGLVSRIGDYPHWDAVWVTGEGFGLD
jgi:putative transposase